MRFDPELQEYVPQNPVVDRTTANIIGTQNPLANPLDLELAAEVAAGTRNLTALTYSELQTLDNVDLGAQMNRMVISEMLARHEQAEPPAADPPAAPNIDTSLAKSDQTAEAAFKSDFKNKFKNDRREDRRNDYRNKRRKE